MKRIKILALGLLFALFACQRDEIPTYDELTSDRYVFPRLRLDSAEVTFAFYPGQTELQIPFVVRVTGSSAEDEYVKLEMVPEGTTADASMYEIPEKCKIRPGLMYDTCWITVKKSAALDTEKFRIQLKLAESEDFKLGRVDDRSFVIWFHNMMAQPSWWSSTVTNYYFGPYTPEKLTAILNFFGKDLVGSDDNQFRQYAIEFKMYLKEQKEAGTPLMEADGTEMVVPVLGNLV